MQKILRRAVALIALTVASIPTWAQETSAMVEASSHDAVTAASACAVADIDTALPALAAQRATFIASLADFQPSPLRPAAASRPAARPSYDIGVPSRHAAHPHDRAGRERPTRITAQASSPLARPAPVRDLRAPEAGVVVGAARTGPHGDINETRCIAEVSTAV